MTRKICFVTGSRAEYGLLRLLMHLVKDSPELDLQIIATGMHLSPEFGFTYQEIEQDGFQIDKKVEMLMDSDSTIGIAKSMGLGLIGFADAFVDLNPDIVVLLGDRFEIFSAATAAHVSSIPIAHIHGGESTQGAFDEALRHSITKMSQIHFAAAEEYRNRIIQLGEHPDTVFNVGGLGIDSLKKATLLSREELEISLGLKFAKRNLLVTFHPVTLESSSSKTQMTELLEALHCLEDTMLIITMPNADTGGRGMIELIDKFVSENANARSFKSLGQLRYLSCIAYVDGVVGNSSSGLLEVPSFKKPTVNIGNRQKGRLQASSVINCEPTRQSISTAIESMYHPEFQAGLPHTKSPYGEGGASELIETRLRQYSGNSIGGKVFYDLHT